MNVCPETEEHIKKLSFELRQLLEKNILKNPEETADGMDRSSEIINEIHSYGFLVNFDIRIDLGKSEADVIVSILKPKDNLSSEDQQAYDNWFLNKAKIKTEPAK